jgi:Thymidylate synthase complementing protein
MNYPNISVKIIADSYNPFTNSRVTTYELEYPRYIHAEIMTHRLFSRNAQSSRAVPVKAALLHIQTNPVYPIEYGRNKAGMSSVEALNPEEVAQVQNIWKNAAEAAVDASMSLNDIGLHKQWANRLTEPFATIKVIITATEFDNFFWLRIDPDAAQPEIVELAEQMYSAFKKNQPVILKNNFWHVPYVYWEEVGDKQVFFDGSGNVISEEVALKISASCCAQVSYRKLDDSLEKALDIYQKLFSGPKPHMSPVEHQAKCFRDDLVEYGVWMQPWEQGITHVDRQGNPWSNNLKGFIQYRALIEDAVHLG